MDLAAPEEVPSLNTVLNALDDVDCRTILRETADPTPAADLADACGIPRSTLYRKLELLTEASLVRECETINPGGGRTTKYERDMEGVTVALDADDEFSVTVERPNRDADDRIVDAMW
ncbi:winged helix-turn-helix domain-containing protein [Halolamina sediminis]|jgi:predicted transcriptional regulator|uniref:winged helix-turn-helix domain-containing protein n=1 Tax=Halolamina sediminis TaxID=1480675 RepID=UPI0006B68664|nr:helix-turn-helix domain-containing protein [Halolamina sediminis]